MGSWKKNPENKCGDDANESEHDFNYKSWYPYWIFGKILVVIFFQLNLDFKGIKSCQL